MGTSSGTRDVACSSSRSTGFRRSDGGSQPAWLSRGTFARAAFPLAVRSFGVGWGTGAGARERSDSAELDPCDWVFAVSFVVALPMPFPVRCNPTPDRPRRPARRPLLRKGNTIRDSRGELGCSDKYAHRGPRPASVLVRL